MIKKTVLVLTALCFLVSAHAQWDGTSAPWTQGNGTQSNPYRIETPQQLAYLSDMVSGGVSSYQNTYFLQTADFDMNNRAWTPIGDDTSRAFKGHYNGGNHQIERVFVNNSTYMFQGLFGCVIGGSVKNVKCEVRINHLSPVLNRYVGGVCAYLKNGTIDGCVHSGLISDSTSNGGGTNDYSYIGGIAGIIHNSTVSRCGNDGEIIKYLDNGYLVWDQIRMAGVVGLARGGNIVLCYNKANITATGYWRDYTVNDCTSDIWNRGPEVSGITNGEKASNSITYVNNIDYCYNSGNINITNNATYSSSVCGSHNWDYNRSYPATYANGIASNCLHNGVTGYNNTSLKGCYNSGNIVATTNASYPPYLYGCAYQNTTNCYYRSDCGPMEGGISRSASSMKSVSFPVILNTDSTVFVTDQYNINQGYPVHAWSVAYNITTDAADDLTSYAARLHGHFSGSADSIGFVYWSQGGGTTRVRLSVNSSPAELTLSGLLPATQYSYSFFVCSNGQTAYGDTLSFTTHPLYTVTVSSENPLYGTVTGSGSFGYGEVDTLVAIPTEHYELSQWSDGNSDNPRYLTVTQNISLTAQFGVEHHTVTLTANNALWGSTTGSGSYEYGSLATINAVPAAHYHFTQWSDGNTSAQRTLPVSGDISLTAFFAPDQHIVTILSGNSVMGTVSGGGTFDYGYIDTIEAIPYNHYVFEQWSDNNTENPRYVQVNGDITLTAQFGMANYLLTLQVNNPAWGSVVGGGSFAYGTSQMIAAQPAQGYHFAQWSDGNTDNPRVLTIEDNLTLVATFAPNQYTVSVYSSDSTKGTVSGGGTFDYGQQIYIIATPLGNYSFSQWSDGNTEAFRQVTVTQTVSYTALFTDAFFTITGESNNIIYGTVTGGGSYANGSTVTLTAVANNGYHFVQWSDGVTENPRTITVSANATYYAQFAVNNYTINVTSSDVSQGSVTGGGIYSYLTTVTMQATPTQYHRFVQWDDGVTTNPRIITVTSDSSFIAQFEPIEQYTVTVVSDNPARGTVTGGGTFYVGTQIPITATPLPNNNFTHWSDGNTEAIRTITVNDNTTYTAYFEAVQYTVSVFSNDPNLGSVAGGGGYEYGSQATVTATPTAGNHFVRWSNGAEENPYTFTVYNDVNLVATFQQGIGIDNHQGSEWYAFAQNGSIILKNLPEGELVSVYDMLGKLLYTADSAFENDLRIAVPSSGVYAVRVGNSMIKKVVVTK